MEHTQRGFSILEFYDRCGNKCSLQKSSLATEDCIWLGCDNIGLMHFKAGKGWTEINFTNTIEEHFIANTRMELTQENVKKLLPYLIKFAETGELE